MADRTIGKVAVKVIPDTSNFRRDLKTDLDAIEKSLKPLKVKVEFDGKRLRSEAARMRRIVQSALKPVKLDINLNMDGVGNEAAVLAALGRDRTVKVKPELDKVAYTATMTALSRLSGARILRLKFDRFASFLKNIDTASLRIAALGTGIAGIAGATINSAAALFSLSSSLASIGGAALALPGILGGFAVGLGISAAALKDWNKELPTFASEMSRLQRIISRNFWDEFRAPMQALADKTFPILRREVAKTATQLGKFFGNLATSIGDKVVPRLTEMFGHLNESIKIAATGTDAYANIIAILGAVGASYLPRLAQWFVDISNKFNDWLSAAEADGRLKGWIDTGIEALKNLGTVLRETVEVFHTLGKAATIAGGDALGKLAGGMTKFSDWLKSEAVFSELVQTFSATSRMMKNIADIAGPSMQRALANIADTAQRVFPVVGNIIGTLLAGIGTALSDPALQDGIVTMFESIESAAKKLEPIWPKLAKAIAIIAPVIGTVADVLAGVFAKSLDSLVPVLEDIMPVVEDLVKILGGALVKALDIVEPQIEKVSGAFSKMMKNNGLPAVKKIIELTMPLLKKLAPILGDLIAEAITRIGELLPKLTEAWALLVAVVEPLIPILGFVASILLDSVIGAISGAIGFITGLLQTIKGLSDFLVGVFTLDWKQAWEGIAAIADGIWEMLKGAFFVLLNVGILGAFKKIGAVFKSLWDDLWNAVKNFATGLWDDITRKFDDFWTGMTGAVSRGISSVKGFFSDGWNTIKTTVSSAWSEVKTSVTTGVDDVIATVKDLPEKCRAALSTIGTVLVSAGKKLITGFIDGIKDKFNDVKNTLGDLTGKLTGWKGPESLDRVLLVDAGRLIIDGLIKGLESRYGAVRKSLTGLTNEIARTDMGNLAVPGNGVGRRVSGVIDGAYATGGVTQARVLNYHAAPGSSFSTEEDFFAAANRARSGW